MASFASPFIVTGDLNVRFDRPENAATAKVNDLLTSYGAVQHIDQPTRVRGGILDVVITSVECLHYRRHGRRPWSVRSQSRTVAVRSSTVVRASLCRASATSVAQLRPHQLQNSTNVVMSVRPGYATSVVPPSVERVNLSDDTSAGNLITRDQSGCSHCVTHTNSSTGNAAITGVLRSSQRRMPRICGEPLTPLSVEIVLPTSTLRVWQMILPTFSSRRWHRYAQPLTAHHHRLLRISSRRFRCMFSLHFVRTTWLGWCAVLLPSSPVLTHPPRGYLKTVSTYFHHI